MNGCANCPFGEHGRARQSSCRRGGRGMLSARMSRRDGGRGGCTVSWFIGQSIIMIAAAFLLGILVGWLIWGRILRPDRSAAVRAASAPAAVEAAEPAVAETPAEPEPAPEHEPEPVPEPVIATQPEP